MSEDSTSDNSTSDSKGNTYIWNLLVFFMEGIITPIGADVGATNTEAICMVATNTEHDEKECKFALKGLSSCQASFSCTAHSGTYRENTDVLLHPKSDLG